MITTEAGLIKTTTTGGMWVDNGTGSYSSWNSYPWFGCNNAATSGSILTKCNLISGTGTAIDASWYVNDSATGIKYIQYPGTYQIDWKSNYPDWKPRNNPSERLREMIRNRMAPAIRVRSNPLKDAKDEREQRARETLRSVVGEEKYRNFLRVGFISIRGKSGRVYQLFPGHNFTRVYEQGKQLKSMCVVLQGDFPPTDSIIMRYLMILNNEQQFGKIAIKHTADAMVPHRIETPDSRPLVSIFGDFKKQAA